jgi:bifunctional DNA-binding transcriptional regulator/antitoxin component of YhaV-PrlF toxin-antitoxin module
MKLLGDLGTLGIRGQIETEEERARTVPLYTDVKKLRKRLKLKSGDVYAFLLRRDGGIVWRGEGDIDMEEIQQLEAAVAEVLSAPAPDPTDHPDLGEGGDAEPEDGGEETEADGADDSDRAAAD